jgi:hypothetical protein
MAFLDFIRNRSASQQQSAQQQSQSPKPENAKQMYARQDAQERANSKPVDRLPPDQRAQVDAIRAKLDKATQHMGGNAQSHAQTEGHNDTREAARQNMTAQDKNAPALSPTSAQHGKTAHDVRPSQESTEKTQPRQQTISRPKPSWER